MKTAFLSAIILAGAIGVSVTAEQCDLSAIQEALQTGSTTHDSMTSYESKCLEATGYNIFEIETFPTPEQAKDAQLSSDCATLINAVNGQANVMSQCTIQVGGKNVTYGYLISSFINGKTGNESDSGSGSIEFPSESASGSESESESGSSSTASSNSTTTSNAATTALSFVTYGAIAAIAVALR